MPPSFGVNISVVETGRRRPEYNIDSDLNGEITLQDLLEWTKAALIITADQILAEEQAMGFDKNPVITVDDRANKKPADVSPLGKIQFTARQDMSTIVLETYNALLFRSKVLTGTYKSSHYVFLNGTQVATDLSSLTGWLETNPEFKDADLIRFVNIQPYARRLERYGITAQRSKTSYRESGRKKGKGASTGKLVLVPNGAYQLTARAIRSKYKRNSIIKFTFIPGSSLGLAGSFSKGRKGKNSSGRPYLYPSISISVQERGTL